MATKDNSKTAKLKKMVNNVLWGLGVQFVLGMLTNLFAVAPDDPKYKTEPLFIKSFFFAHALIGTLLLISSIYVLVLSQKSGIDKFKKAGLYGLLSILLAAVAGFATISFKDLGSELSSFVMALGFLLAFTSYWRYYSLLKE